MSPRVYRHVQYATSLILLALLVTSCDRAGDDLRAPPEFRAAVTGTARLSDLQPGAPAPAAAAAPYREDEWTVYAGERLYAFLNCVGCHANGGGGIGPPLMDDEWIYGSAPQNIFASIWQGRPQGMPAFGGRISTQETWLLVAYVRAVGGLTAPALRVSPPSFEQ